MNSPESRIWVVVGLIPAGKVASYGQIAELAGLPGRSRMVSKWMGMAPDEMELPWHRVINSQGSISIPKASEYYALQRDLLISEGVRVIEGRVKLKEFGWEPDMVEVMFSLEL